MKNLLLLLITLTLLAGCTSKEEKIAKLIKDDMFKSLYDFSSYEPIETKIDSAYTSIYTDSIAILCAYTIKEHFDLYKDYIKKTKEAQRDAEIWSDSYSSFGNTRYKQALEDAKSNLDKAKEALDITEAASTTLKIRMKEFHAGYCGWRATHKFRCKTKGGNFTLGNYSYIIDEKMTTIITKQDLDDENLSEIKSLIKEYVVEVTK